MSSVRVDIKINEKALENKLDQLIDTKTMLQIHNLLAKYCDPYVPFLNGPLSQTNIVTPWYVKYIQPYARYQYYGVGFNHTKDFHPKASAMWDKAMLREKRDSFLTDIKRILKRRADEIDG